MRQLIGGLAWMAKPVEFVFLRKKKVLPVCFHCIAFSIGVAIFRGKGYAWPHVTSPESMGGDAATCALNRI